jgi:general secretion pathway protein G
MDTTTHIPLESAQTAGLLRAFAPRRQAGMNLIEIIIVIALIGLVMSIVVTNLVGTQDEAMKDAARLAMVRMQQSLQLYRVHNGSYPSSEQGLQALVSDPGNARSWRGPYIEAEKLNDPWGRPFRYESGGREFQIVSDGPDANDPSDDIYYPEQPKQ